MLLKLLLYIVRIEQACKKHGTLTEAGTLAATVVRNLPVKGFTKKGLNGRLAKHINNFIKRERIPLYRSVHLRSKRNMLKY